MKRYKKLLLQRNNVYCLPISLSRCQKRGMITSIDANYKTVSDVKCIPVYLVVRLNLLPEKESKVSTLKKWQGCSVKKPETRIIGL